MGSRNRSRSHNFLSQLSGASSEFCLIFFLFIISALSYLASKFAKYCKLQDPCLLCSPLCRQPWFGGDLICDAHKLEISGLALCERHNKLGFAQDLCRRCHLSCSYLINETSDVLNPEKEDCSCCFRKRGNLQNVSKGKEKVLERKEKLFHMKSLIDLEEIGYREVKTISDSESESKHESGTKFAGSTSHNVNDQSLSKGTSDSRNAECTNQVLEKAIHASPIPKPSPLIDSGKKINLGESSEAASSEAASSKTGVGHGLEEINWNHFSRSGTGTSTRNQKFSATSEQNVVAESPKPNEDTGLPTISDPCRQKRTPCHISIKRVLSKRGSFQSPKPSEIISSKDNLTTQEDINNLFTQITTPRLGLRAPPSSMLFDESVNSIPATIDRNNSSLDSFEVNTVSDIEGENSENKLRRQVEMDKINMRILYQELEEERNASAIAASQAMNMINRLQEEKAGLKMESLQYLRMMEEEAGFDNEAIDKLNDLLTQKDKEIAHLKAEVEEFKRDFLKFENGLVLGYEEKGFVMERLKWLKERVCCNHGEKLERENETIEEGLRKEVVRLSERFERIEMDDQFISHALGAFKENLGDERIKFVEEIAANLSELRKITIDDSAKNA